MERRTFLQLAGSLAFVPSAAAAAAQAAPPDPEAEAIMRRLIQWYRAFGTPGIDRDYYRSFMTDDYLLLENGELLDLAGDMALMDKMSADYKRTDRFDFRRIRVDGDDAYAVYFLESDIVDSKEGARHRRWLESAIFRREGGQWRAALLHSTRISPPAS